MYKMDIGEFIANYKNHPVMFIGTGLSLRYLKNSYSWENLLKKIALEFNPNEEYYLDIKAKYMKGQHCAYEKVATDLEKDWEITLLSSLITLTPGTIVVHVSDDQNTLYIHGIDEEDTKEAIDSIKNTFEKAIKEVSRP